MTDLQKKILEVFWHEQFDDEDGAFHDDETPCVRYSQLEKETGVDRSRLKPEIIDLRNQGILQLVMTVDCDYQPSGSGYIVTDDKGVELVRELFLKKE